MTNAAETQQPIKQKLKKLNTEETLAPGNIYQVNKSRVLLPGEVVADSYVINSTLNFQGKQANVYLAKKEDKFYVVKMYNNDWHPSNQILSYLINVHHPNIANVVEYGYTNGNYYEIYEYYFEGTLESVNGLSREHIQNIIVPSINEGLHELHRNGIIHCDIKPSNLFYSDKMNKVVIGDCGVSIDINSNGKYVGAIRGTSEYAPKITTLSGYGVYLPAYDYGSFGLVLYKVMIGYSLFRGMSCEEILKARERGIELPSNASGSLGVLIKGLLNENEEKRWGYMQVKRWCEGEFVSSVDTSIYVQTKRKYQIKPLIFGCFDGQIIAVYSLHQLAKAIRTHWSQAKKIVKRHELLYFIYQFDTTLIDKVQEFSLYKNLDVAVFKLLLSIEGDYQGIYFIGKKYESIVDYIEHLVNGKDAIAKKFLSSGMFVFYLRENGYEKSLIDKLEKFIQRNGTDDMKSIAAMCFILQDKKTVDVFGNTVETLDELIPIIYKHSTKEINQLLENNNFTAWLIKLGFENEMRRMKEEF